MRKLVLGLALLVSCAGTSPASTTWAGTADTQLVTGAALNDGATATSLWTMSSTPPSTKIMSVGAIKTYTDIPISNLGYPDSRCPTKIEILSVY
jgi:tetrahydromethanopterin S-methyltransferase subunit D